MTDAEEKPALTVRHEQSTLSGKQVDVSVYEGADLMALCLSNTAERASHKVSAGMWHSDGLGANIS